MSLTGLTIDASSTVPSRAEFSTFLKDGVIDVTSKWLVGHPQDRDDFVRESAETTSNASLDLGGADIISVIREDGVTSNNWRPCRKISIGQQYLVTDTESLSFASKINPAYMVGDTGKISVFPAPGSDPNAFKVYYVNNSPVETGGSALDHASTGIEYFPSDKIYLVILYASIKSLNAKMTSIITDLGTFSVATVIADTLAAPSFTAPDISGIFNPASSPPAYTAPTIGDVTEELTTTMDADSSGSGTDADFLNFSKWFSVAGDYIEDQQDTELAGTQISKISTYLNAYSQAMQNKLNIFNDANVEYQAQLQQAQAEAGLKLQEENQEYAAKLQKYQAEVQSYVSEVNTEVQEQATKIQTESAKYQWLQDRAAALQAEYAAAFATPQPAGAAR